jgi:hypothetical protein
LLKASRPRPQTAKQLHHSPAAKPSQLNLPGQSKVTQKLSFRTQNDEVFQSSRLKQSRDLLHKKIAENALDKKWEYVIKVGEMNAWARTRARETGRKG